MTDPFDAVAGAAEGGRKVVVVRYSDLRPRPVHFLWHPWIPLGKVTLLAGAPGHGKSQLAAFLAAATTRHYFDPTDLDGPGKVILLTGEDDPEDTVLPRLLAAGADPRLVEGINMRTTAPGGITVDGLIKLPGDLPTLQERLEQGGVRLVVFDPVASFVGREHSTYVNQDVRDLLDPVAALARHYGVAIVLVLHLNKTETKSWANKISESHAFQALARTVLVFAPDPDDEDGEQGTEKLLAATKVNLVRSAVSALQFRVRPTTVLTDDGGRIETSKVELLGSKSVAADDLLSDLADRSARRDVIAFLVETLASGSLAGKDLKAQARQEGIAWRTVQRYYREVCKPARPERFGGPWVYALEDRHLPAHTPGAHGADWQTSEPEWSQSAPSAPGDIAGDTQTTVANGAHGALRLDDYRRLRDRQLGEREEEW